MTLRLNIGCGRSPTPDWINYDNSPAVRLARIPAFARLLARLGLIYRYGLEFVDFCRHHRIRSANAAGRIPHAASSVEAIYASHMLEHLDRGEARAFLAECRRVLASGGRGHRWMRWLPPGLPRPSECGAGESLRRP